MKNLTTFTFLILICFNSLNAQTPDVFEPYYGGAEKSQEQIIIDSLFVKEVVEKYGTRAIAAKMHINFGWDYFKKGDYNTAMKRFNQAWLLDSTLVDVNWGFGAVFGAKKQYEQSIFFLKKYYDLNPNNSRILIDLATAYFQNALSLKQRGFNEEWRHNIAKGKSCLHKSIIINDRNAYAFSQLAVAYYYENKLDSSKYYGQIANKLDPNVVHPELKMALGIK